MYAEACPVLAARTMARHLLRARAPFDRRKQCREGRKKAGAEVLRRVLGKSAVFLALAISNICLSVKITVRLM
jgi:hypothetical protein